MSGRLLGVLAFVVVGLTTLRWVSLIRAVAIPRDRTLLYGFFGVGAFFGLLALLNQPGWIGGGLALAALMVGTLMPVLRLWSGQAHLETTVPLGATVPPFSALADNGRTFESMRLAGKPYLLKFFRGHW